MGLKKNIAGQRFGKLVAVEEAGSNTRRQVLWSCRCDCGLSHVVSGTLLRRGEARSCGCAQYAGLDTTKHGETRGRQMSREYSIWLGMKQRCTNPRHKDYAHYAGRGIGVHPAWLDSFDAFLEDVGRAPSADHTLDRFPDNDGDYAPGNVRWATRTEQAHNSRVTHWITYKGERLTVGQWAARIGVRPSTLSGRLQRGWSEAEALEKR